MVLVRFEHGGRVRRCDARCYNGESSRCTCVCGGINHGVGIQRALENSREALGLPEPGQASLEDWVRSLLARANKKDKAELRQLLRTLGGGR